MHRFASLAIVLVTAAVCVVGAALAEPAGPRFRAMPAAAATSSAAAATSAIGVIGAQVLTPEERDFIARLPEIRVAVAQPAFRPYEVIDATGEVSGIHPEMLVALAQTFGLRLRPVVFASWAASMQAAERGEVDLLMSVGMTPQRAERFEFTLGVTPMLSGVIARKAGPGVKPSPPLEQGVFAVQTSKLANDYVKRQFPQARLVEVASQAQAFEAVASAAADYHVTDLLPALDRLARQPVAGIEVSQLVSLGSGYYHFAVRKDWALLARILNKGLTGLRVTPSPPLAAALAAWPAASAAPLAMPLTRHQQAVIWDFPVWRVGAVRGLSLLNEVTPDGQHSGVGAEYLEAVARRLGVGLKIVPFDSVAALLDALRAGAIDVVPLLTQTPARARDFAYSNAYIEMPYVIVARDDAPLYWDLHSLRGKRLALALQHPLRDWLAQGYTDIRILDVGSGQAAMDAVSRGDADAAVEVKFFANLRIHADNDGRLRAGATVTEVPGGFHFATARRAQALVPLINEVLAEITPAERERMMRRWIAPDQVPSFPWRRHLPALLAATAALLVLGAVTVWWLLRLQREVRARRQAQMQLADIEAALPCVAFRGRFDAQGALQQTHFSAGASRILGFEPDPRLSMIQNLGPRLDATDLSALQAAQQRSLSQGERIQVNGCYHHPDGGSRWLNSEVLSRREADGGTTLTGYLADVTDEHALQQRVLQEAQARHLMLASASHELRAPTHTISLALQAMAGAALRPWQSQPLDEVRAATNSLARRLNELLDMARQDRIGVDKGVDKGADKAADMARTLPPPSLPLNLPGGRAARHGPVLLCDDDEVSRLLLAHMLARHGYPTLHAADGAAALALLGSGPVGVLITDMNMAGMSGGQLIAGIRAAESAPAESSHRAVRQAPSAGQATRLPIVICSGSPLPAQVLAGVLEQHDAYLLKPVDVEQLVQTLQALGLQPDLSAAAPP